jgi:hypothetical protein
MAPFAFLGADYDAHLEEMYTTYSTKDLVIKHNILNALTGSLDADATPLRNIFAKYIYQRLYIRHAQ